jgi:hypothetical protein
VMQAKKARITTAENAAFIDRMFIVDP